MTTTQDQNSTVTAPTDIDDTDSTYTTQGEEKIYVDTSNGAVTVEVATADINDDGRPIRIFDTGENASSNNLTITTEGSQNINPGSNSSIVLATDGAFIELESDGSNLFSRRVQSLQSVVTESIATELEDGNGLGGSRELGTTYQNTNNYDIWVWVLSTSLGAGDTGRIDAHVKETSTDILLSPQIADADLADGDTGKDRGIVSFRVPAGYYYVINNEGSFTTSSVANWNERGLTGN